MSSEYGTVFGVKPKPWAWRAWMLNAAVVNGPGSGVGGDGTKVEAELVVKGANSFKMPFLSSFMFKVRDRSEVWNRSGPGAHNRSALEWRSLKVKTVLCRGYLPVSRYATDGARDTVEMDITTTNLVHYVASTAAEMRIHMPCTQRVPGQSMMTPLTRTPGRRVRTETPRMDPGVGTRCLGHSMLGS
jgi:hypothetical protein